VRFTSKSDLLLPLHHIQRAIHAFFAEVNEQALQLIMHHPECEAEAQRIVRKSNSLLRQHIGTFKSTLWQTNTDSAALKKLCNDAQTDSLKLLRRIQQAAANPEAFAAARPTNKKA
tara:strand:- start:209 stop:556 length:348 start_codon:yes stop_codon:yes gene_type:complete